MMNWLSFSCCIDMYKVWEEADEEAWCDAIAALNDWTAILRNDEVSRANWLCSLTCVRKSMVVGRNGFCVINHLLYVFKTQNTETAYWAAAVQLWVVLWGPARKHQSNSVHLGGFVKFRFGMCCWTKNKKRK